MKTIKHYNVIGEYSKLNTILTNLEYYGEFHPLIQTVAKVDRGDVDYTEFRIKERPFRWIPISIFYAANVRSSVNRIQYEIIGIPFTKPHIEYELTPLSDREIKVTFQLIIHSNFIINLSSGLLARN